MFDVCSNSSDMCGHFISNERSCSLIYSAGFCMFLPKVLTQCFSDYYKNRDLKGQKNSTLSVFFSSIVMGKKVWQFIAVKAKYKLDMALLLNANEPYKVYMRPFVAYALFCFDSKLIK